MAAKDLSVKDRKLVVAGWRARVFLFNFILLTLKVFLSQCTNLGV
jgi:hypothetical protein